MQHLLHFGPMHTSPDAKYMTSLWIFMLRFGHQANTGASNNLASKWLGSWSLECFSFHSERLVFHVGYLISLVMFYLVTTKFTTFCTLPGGMYVSYQICLTTDFQNYKSLWDPYSFGISMPIIFHTFNLVPVCLFFCFAFVIHYRIGS